MGNYYFSEMGSWSSAEPDKVNFDAFPDTHFEDVFEWAADWAMFEWAEYLAQHPHTKTGTGAWTCDECEKIFEAYKDGEN